MQKINQNGRSMVEMLGVLAIIGVLSVGSFGIVGKARQQYMISQALSEISNLIASARKMSCEYDDGYGSYTNMLYQSREYPDGVQGLGDAKDTDTIITGSEEAEAFLISSDIVVQITDKKDTFSVAVTNIPEDACVALASADWGSRRFNGYQGAKIGGTSWSKDTMMDLDTATTGCSAEGAITLELTYGACVRGGDNK
ncbi:MAG: hypothetical protein IJ770_03485 [Alphaproteobacteria bacterium]|nr:hypothetical protein [Alphaproteobacteria bacterium]